MQQPSPWPPIVIDALFVISITLLLALKVVPTEIGFPLLSMFAGARGAMHLASKGGGNGPGAAGGAASSGAPSAPSTSTSTTLQRVMSGSAVAVLGIALLGYMRRHVPGVAVVALSLVLGCASTSPRDRVVNAANAAKDIGATAETMLAAADRTEQEQCLVTHDKAAADTCVAAVRARYVPAWKAYRDYRLAWLAVAAGVHAYDAADALGKKPDPVAIAVLANDLTDAAAKIEAAIAALQGGK